MCHDEGPNERLDVVEYHKNNLTGDRSSRGCNVRQDGQWVTLLSSPLGGRRGGDCASRQSRRRRRHLLDVVSRWCDFPRRSSSLFDLDIGGLPDEPKLLEFLLPVGTQIPLRQVGALCGGNGENGQVSRHQSFGDFRFFHCGTVTHLPAHPAAEWDPMADVSLGDKDVSHLIAVFDQQFVQTLPMIFEVFVVASAVPQIPFVGDKHKANFLQSLQTVRP